MICIWALASIRQSPTVVHLRVDAVDRQAIVVEPSVKSKGKPPIVFMFHGHGGSAQRCIGHFHVENQWPEAVVVYPDGLPTSRGFPPNDGQGWNTSTNKTNKDLKFFDALRESVLKTYNADPNHEFAMGFSNGGMFVYTLWSARPKEFAAVCPSGAALDSPDIHLNSPLPSFTTVSGNDQMVPTVLQQQAYEAARKVDESQKQGSPHGAHGTYFKGLRPVVLWTYNGGHEFPFEAFPDLIRFFKSIA